MQLRETKQDWKASEIDGKIGKSQQQIGNTRVMVYKNCRSHQIGVLAQEMSCESRMGQGGHTLLRAGVPSPSRSTKAQMFFQSKQSPLNFNENFAHRQHLLPRHLFHSSYSINSPSLFSFKGNKWCFQPSPFHCLWLISAKHWCWLCLWRYSLAVQMCYLNYNAGNTFVSVAFHLLHQALKLGGEESPVFSWAPLYFPLFTSQFVTSEELTHASPSSSFLLQLCVCYR